MRKTRDFLVRYSYYHVSRWCVEHTKVKASPISQKTRSKPTLEQTKHCYWAFRPSLGSLVKTANVASNTRAEDPSLLSRCPDAPWKHGLADHIYRARQLALDQGRDPSRSHIVQDIFWPLTPHGMDRAQKSTNWRLTCVCRDLHHRCTERTHKDAYPRLAVVTLNSVPEVIFCDGGAQQNAA